MIFAMEEKFKENHYYWSRYNGGWMKTVTGLDKSVKNGYSLIGEFVDAGATKNDYSAGLYINCNIDGSRKHPTKMVQLLKLDEDGSLELLKTLENGGRTWAVEFWELIEENLEEEVKMSVGEIAQLINKNLDSKQVQELFKQLGLAESSKLKVSVASFSKVERVDDELKQVIKENNFDFDKMNYRSKSEVLGLAILKTWDGIFDFKEDDIDVEFLTSEHIRNGDVQGYTLYISEKVDGFAKVKDGKISMRLLY